MAETHVPDDVFDFLSECMGEVGKIKGEDFGVEVFGEIQGDAMESPIEQMFYIAVRSVLEMSRPLEVDVKVDRQHSIGRYRVDFLLSALVDEAIRHVIVECDSQQWHERTEMERRYEKKRDRFMVKKGYKIFRFTGAELKARPLQIAVEVLSFLTGIAVEEFVVRSDYTPFTQKDIDG